MAGFSDFNNQLQELGKHKLGKSCLYIKKLEHINLEILKEMITTSVQKMKEKYPS